MSKRVAITRNGTILRREIHKAASAVSKIKVGFKTEDVIQHLKDNYEFTENDRNELADTGLRVLVGRISSVKPITNTDQRELFPDFIPNGFTKIKSKDQLGKFESKYYIIDQLTPEIINSHVRKLPKKSKITIHELLFEFAETMRSEGYPETTTIEEYLKDKSKKVA